MNAVFLLGVCARPHRPRPAVLRLLAGGLLFLLLSAAPAAGSPPQAETVPYPVAEEHFFSHFFQVLEVNEPVYLVLVDKSEQRLLVLEHNSSLKVVAQYPCATGENSGPKAISGDARTPEGIYFITQIYEDNKISVFGNRAFQLDYPNIYDAEEGRDGAGIYIHGTNKPLAANSTNGCISMANKDLEGLEAFLGKYITPVVIVKSLQELAEKQNPALPGQDFGRVREMLLPSEVAPEKATFDLFYLINFGPRAVAVGEYIYKQCENCRMRGYSRAYLEFSQAAGWSARKRIWQYAPAQIFPANPVKVAARLPLVETVEFPAGVPRVQDGKPAASEAAALAAAPGSPPVSAAPAPATPSAPVEKKVAADPRADHERPARITVTPLQSAPEPAPRAAPAAAEKSGPPAGSPGDRQAILDFIENWRQAWQAKAIDAYIGAYDKSFRQGRDDLAAWRTYKEKLNKKYAKIRVEISDIDISWTSSGAIVSFKQFYRSDMFSSRGRKTLELIHSDRGWRIRREQMAPGKG